MGVYLPRNLSGLVAIASKGEGRYATNVSRVLDPGNGLYRCEATDGKMLASVQGPVPDVSYPAVDAGEVTPQLLVPRDVWVKGFKLLAKHLPVGIASAGQSVTLAVGDQLAVGELADGRFPDVSGAIPKRGPLVALRIAPALLMELLRLAEAVCPEGGVNLLYYGKGSPLGLSARNEQGQTFDALLMPSPDLRSRSPHQPKGASLMAHEIDQTTGRAAIFVAGEPAWHRLGTVIAQATTSAEAIQLAALDWTVSQ